MKGTTWLVLVLALAGVCWGSTLAAQEEEEGNQAAVAEYDEQIAESKEHAQNFKRMLEIAAKRFAALAKVEERHANNYRAVLAAAQK